MQFSTIFVSLFLSSAVTAMDMSNMDMSGGMANMPAQKEGSSMEGMDMSKDGMTMPSTKDSSKNTTNPAKAEEKACKKMLKLASLIDLAANTTKLTQVTQNNQTKIDSIKAKAAQATTNLDEMKMNATLVADCEVIDSVLATKSVCKQMKKATKLVAIAGNQTALDAKTGGNSTKAAKIVEMADRAKSFLAEMQTNSTLTDACGAFAAEKKAEDAGKTTQAATAATEGLASKSVAVVLEGRVGLVGTTVLVAVGMMML